MSVKFALYSPCTAALAQHHAVVVAMGGLDQYAPAVDLNIRTVEAADVGCERRLPSTSYGYARRSSRRA